MAFFVGVDGSTFRRRRSESFEIFASLDPEDNSIQTSESEEKSSKENLHFTNQVDIAFSKDCLLGVRLLKVILLTDRIH